MALEIRVDCDESCFDMPEWHALLERDPDRHVFATQLWNRLWWEEFSTGKELFLLTMRRDGDIAAVVPLYRKQEGDRKVLRFIGGIELTDYLGPICSLDDRDDVADALVRWLSDTDIEWDELDAHNMPVPFGFADFLVESADRRGFAFALQQEETTAVLPLPDEWDAYLTDLDSKDRHELRRKRRRLARDHPDATFRTSTEDELDHDLKTFFEMHRGAQGSKGHFLVPDIATFFMKLADAFAGDGSLRLDFLEIAGSPIASTFGFQFNRTFYLYNSAYEEDAARLSPGFVLVSELLKQSIEGGCETFDFLRGPERYKYQLGAQAVPLNNVRVLKHAPA